MATDDRRTPSRDGHPLPARVDALAVEVGSLGEVSLVALDAAATRGSLLALARLRNQLDALTLRVAAHAEDVQAGAACGATSTGAWWAVATHQDRPAAAGLLRLATALTERWHTLARGCARGEVALDQARVIVRALEELPEDLEPEQVALAEKVLVGYAAEHDPATLKVLGRRVLDVVAPEVAEAHEQRKIEAEEARALEKQRLTLSFDGHGAAFLRATIPQAQAAMLKKALYALASPRHRAALEAGQDPSQVDREVDRPTPQKLGAAFCALIEVLPADRLPTAGGTDATTVVIAEHATLLTGLGHAHLDTGEQISAAQARRLACSAGILPVVMDGASVVLDAGRERRFHSRTQRLVIGARDEHCTAEGCDWPPGMCEVHHDHAWSQGGPTDIDHARLLCPHHHRRVHDRRYDVSRVEGNKLRFHRRT